LLARAHRCTHALASDEPERNGFVAPNCKMSITRERGGGWRIEGVFVRSPWEFLGMHSEGSLQWALETIQRIRTPLAGAAA
jgi:hypothetical protein